MLDDRTKLITGADRETAARLGEDPSNAPVPPPSSTRWRAWWSTAG
ncbi:hypothetical protein O1M63_51520 [Streptomyces mirabilis]|nr:hypothetical protein [Streptomyces mirabilis]